MLHAAVATASKKLKEYGKKKTEKTSTQDLKKELKF